MPSPSAWSGSSGTRPTNRPSPPLTPRSSRSQSADPVHQEAEYPMSAAEELEPGRLSRRSVVKAGIGLAGVVAVGGGPLVRYALSGGSPADVASLPPGSLTVAGAVRPAALSTSTEPL